MRKGSSQQTKWRHHPKQSTCELKYSMGVVLRRTSTLTLQFWNSDMMRNGEESRARKAQIATEKALELLSASNKFYMKSLAKPGYKALYSKLRRAQADINHLEMFLKDAKTKCQEKGL